MRVSFLGWEDLMEEKMTTHSSILAWEIPWTEEPGRLYSPQGCKSPTRLRDLSVHALDKTSFFHVCS